MLHLKHWGKSGLGNEVFGAWAPSSCMHVGVLVHPADRRMCAVTVYVPHPYMHPAKYLHTGSWAKRRVGCHLRLLAMAEPAWHKGGSELPLSPCAPGTASPTAGEGERSQPRGSHGQQDCHAQGRGAGTWGPDAAAREQLFRQFPLAVSTGSHKVPRTAFLPRGAPQLAAPMA